MQIDGVTVFGVGTRWRATFSAKPHLMMPYSALFRAIVAELHDPYNRVA
jgi:hypothetical protein